MFRIKLTICLSFICLLSYSQTEQEILTNVLCRYKTELPGLEKQALKELKKVDKHQSRYKESNKYKLIFLPIFRLKNEYINYQNHEDFVKYIDFDNMYDDFTILVFLDDIYKGSMHLSDYDKAYFSVNDTNKYNKTVFLDDLNFARQIREFNADMVFYPCSYRFICLIKEGNLYIAGHEKQFSPLNFILPIDEFVKESPTFIKDLESDPCLGLKHYLKLKNCVMPM